MQFTCAWVRSWKYHFCFFFLNWSIIDLQCCISFIIFVLQWIAAVLHFPCHLSWIRPIVSFIKHHNMGQIHLRKIYARSLCKRKHLDLNTLCENCNIGLANSGQFQPAKHIQLFLSHRSFTCFHKWMWKLGVHELLCFFSSISSNFVRTLECGLKQEFALWLHQTTVPYPAMSVKATDLAIALCCFTYSLPKTGT